MAGDQSKKEDGAAEVAPPEAAGGLAPRTQTACELPGQPPLLDGSRVLRHTGAGWDGVRLMPYRADGAPFSGVTRRVLAAPEEAAFDLRYFELDPGGHTTLERHLHVHVVVCYRGVGRVRLGDEVHEVGFGDVVYVAPDEPHQFLNPYAEPFGFLCVVDRERDHSVPMEGDRADA